jgi:Holliday junction resolvasome RuvABC endonuclease subunit
MILALDLAFANTGWAILEKGKLIKFGTIKTEKTKVKNTLVSDDRATRATHLAQELVHLIQGNDIKAIVGELPSGSQNATAANLLGWAGGVAVAVATCHKLPCEWISQGDSKKITLGVRSATKEAMMEWATGAYPDTVFPSAKCNFEHVADSLSAYNGLRSGILVRTFG